jgi:hypothetical protein
MKPILFSTEMVKAIKAGIKTQTRRIASELDEECRIEEGDTLYVKETYAKQGDSYIYKADFNYAELEKLQIKWRPSIFMPKDAARLFLKVTNVRKERLHDISEQDLRAEGINSTIGYYPLMLEMFEEIWNNIHGNKAWNQNPLVWVIEFEKLENYIA